MLQLKAIAQQFVHHLFLVVQGSIQVYLAVTQRFSGEEKQEAAWKEYNEAFDEYIIPQLLEVMERNNLGVAEMCHATLKLLQIGAQMVEVAEENSVKQTDQSETDNYKAWFVSNAH